MSKQSVPFEYGKLTGKISTGEIAKQATGAALVELGETTVLVTVVGASSKTGQRKFLPLQVEYREKDYGKSYIRGGFIKREGRPAEREILSARIIDRIIRPLFPDNFFDEVQVIISILSMDPAVGAVVASMAGVSAALKLSGLPFSGPVAIAEVCSAMTDDGMPIEGQFTLKDYSNKAMQTQLDLTIGGTADAVVMVESSANEFDEAQMLAALEFGHAQLQPIIEAVDKLAETADIKAWEHDEEVMLDEDLVKQVESLIGDGMKEAYSLLDKQARTEKLAQVLESAKEHFSVEDSDESDKRRENVSVIFHQYQKEYVRQQILDGKSRIDGRDAVTVRPIETRVGFLPRVHGSALFTRGETQAIVTATLGGDQDAQRSEDIAGEDERQEFMLHYNFPPFCVGEVGFIGSTKRREIGHGHLARKALEAVLPKDKEAFPYTIRVVSEITESCGSSSQASVCGASMALMDAGVPLKSPVAGIAMGLIMKGDSYKVLTDILADEDHLGDMDFKVAGTKDGITALQMDIKIKGITMEIMGIALAQAKEARLHILAKMAETINEGRAAMSPYAPQVISIKINPDKIRDVIGKGGATIREIIDTYKVDIDISDDGVVKISGINGDAIAGAKAHVEQLTADVEIGQVYEGKIVKIMDFGAFVSLLPGKDGFLHISQISNERVNDINEWLSEGQEVVVKVVEIDKQGRTRVSMRAMQSEITG